jgi:hypothetical protein
LLLPLHFTTLQRAFVLSGCLQGLSASVEAPQGRVRLFVAISIGHTRASQQTISSYPQQQQWRQASVFTRPKLPQLPPSATTRLPTAAGAALTCVGQQQQQQQHALLPRLLHTSAAAYKRVSVPDNDEDLPEDELEVLLDEDEDFDIDEAEFEDEQLYDLEWVGDGELATTRHATGGARSNSYDDDDDETGEYDVEFDEAWEDEEEVDDLRDEQDAGSEVQRS